MHDLEDFIRGQIARFPHLKAQVEQENTARDKRQKFMRNYLSPVSVHTFRYARERLNDSIAAFVDWESRLKLKMEKMREKGLKSPKVFSYILRPQIEPKVGHSNTLLLGGCGQACICLKRLYIHENIYSAVTDALIAVARSARVGDGFDPDTMLGPAQNRLQYQRLKSVWEEITKSRAIRGRLSNRFSITISPRLGGRIVEKQNRFT